MSLSRCVAFVTGAASGLGRSTAARIVRNGGRVVIADLPSSNGEEVAAEISGQDGVDASSGPRCVFAPVDVTSEADVTSGLDLVDEAFGEPLNAVVNCAGIGPPRKTLNKRGPHPLKDFHKILEVNTVGTFNVIRLASERMANLNPETGAPANEGFAHEMMVGSSPHPPLRAATFTLLTINPPHGFTLLSTPWRPPGDLLHLANLCVTTDGNL